MSSRIFGKLSEKVYQSMYRITGRARNAVRGSFIVLAIIASVVLNGQPVLTHAQQATPDPVDYTLGGYADQTSVAQGGTIAFHIATDLSPFDLKIYNNDDPSNILTTIPGLVSQPRDCTGMYEQGCGWPVTTTFTIPNDWPSGYYSARIPTNGDPRFIIFVVRPANPGTTNKTLVISSTNTYQTYNAFGGKSGYDFNSTDRQHANQISFDRPYDDSNGMGRFGFWEQPFVAWMTAHKLPFDVVTDSDLDQPDLLSHYKLVMLVGHSEYWTAEARKQLESFSKAGGHLMILGGNTMWWQERYTDNGRSITIYKNAQKDPERGQDDSLVTTNWYDEPVYNPENQITGASFRYGGYTNNLADAEFLQPLPDDKRIPYTVVDPKDWTMDGLNLKAGDKFGTKAAGLEVDGVQVNCDAKTGAMYPTGSDGTPLNYHILATVPASLGYGMVGYYVNPAGGMVFNAGTRDWADALSSDPVVEGITLNLLKRLSDGSPVPYVAPTRKPLLTEDLFNCPDKAPQLLSAWRGTVNQAVLSKQCAYEGPTGLQLSNAKDNILARNFSPTNKLYTSAFVRLYVNTNALKWPDSKAYPFNLLTLQSKNAEKTSRYAQVQMKVSNTSNAIELLQGLPGNVTEAKSDWQPIGRGWQWIELGWSAPGTITLSVGGKVVATLNNTHQDQGVNEVAITFSKTDVQPSGYLCLDALAVNTAHIDPAQR